MAKRSVVMVLTKDMLKPHLDGRVYKEAKTLVKRGYSVTVLCRLYSLDDLEEEVNYKGIRIIRHLCELPKGEFVSRVDQLLQNYKNVRSMAKRIVELKPDIIHAHDLNALLESVYAKRKLKVPLVYDSHEDWPKLEQTKGNNILYLLALIYENFLLTHVSGVITVNPILARNFERKILTQIIYNYPMASTFKPKPEIVKEIQEKYNLFDKIVIEYHGVIGRMKGMDKIIELAPGLVKKYKKLRFLIIGEDYDKFVPIVKAEGLEKHIFFTGPVPYEFIPSYIAASDISYLALQPTSQYLVSTPTKLFEAMLMGKPVVANAEFPEVARIMGKEKEKRPGIMVNYTSQDIKQALDDLIKSRELRDRFGQFGKDKVLKHFTWESQEQELIDMYKRIFSN